MDARIQDSELSTCKKNLAQNLRSLRTITEELRVEKEQHALCKSQKSQAVSQLFAATQRIENLESTVEIYKGRLKSSKVLVEDYKKQLQDCVESLPDENPAEKQGRKSRKSRKSRK